MMQFSYSFCLTLVHSIWQSALLLLLYVVLNSIVSKQPPAYRRNLLYLLLLVQLFTSVLSFIFHYTRDESNFTASLVSGINAIAGNQSFLQNTAPYLFFVYSLVVVIKTTSLLQRWVSFRKNFRNNIIKPSAELKVFTGLRAMEMGISRKVTLWYSNMVSTPVTFGFLKPVILLPVSLVNNLSIKEAETLIIHELTHIKQHDYLLNWLLIIFSNIYFFNPFISILARKIKTEREMNCDVQVLNYNYPGILYAETLLKTALSNKGTARQFQLAAVVKNNELLKRIVYFTSEKNLQYNKKRYPVFTGFSMVLALSLTVMATLYLINFRKITKANKETVAAFKINTPPNTKETNRNLGSFPAGVIIQLEEPVAMISEPENPGPGMNNIVSDGSSLPALDTELATLSSFEENYVSPVAAIESNNKEVIIKEENSETGETVTKAYRMRYKDGEWTPELLWMLTETRPEISVTDSCNAIESPSGIYQIPQAQ